MKETPWAQLLAYATGLINQELLLKNQYLAAENRILRAHLAARLRLSDPERSTLAEIGKRLGRKALAQVACVAKPDTAGWPIYPTSPGALRCTCSRSRSSRRYRPAENGRSRSAAGAIRTGAGMAGNCSTLRQIDYGERIPSRLQAIGIHWLRHQRLLAH